MRKYGFLAIGAFTIIGLLVVIFALLEDWRLSTIFLVALLFLVAGTSLMSARYLARLLRTESNKIRQESLSLDGKYQNYFSELMRGLQEFTTEHNSASRIILETNKGAIQNLESKVDKSTRSLQAFISTTSRHSNNEIEALIQIYRHFPETKLPMLPSGGWAIDAESLAYLLEYVRETKPKIIVELGSGTSTIWLGYLCKAIGARLVTLDHLEHYLEQTRASIRRHGLTECVESRLAPLEQYSLDGGKYSWYSASALEDLEDIDLLLVDGPPAATGPQARYPALPVLERRLATGATVILDDAHRPHEEEVLAAWLKKYPAFSRLTIGTQRLAIIKK